MTEWRDHEDYEVAEYFPVERSQRSSSWFWYICAALVSGGVLTICLWALACLLRAAGVKIVGMF